MKVEAKQKVLSGEKKTARGQHLLRATLLWNFETRGFWDPGPGLWARAGAHLPKSHLISWL
jgi:hypothetical protein